MTAEHSAACTPEMRARGQYAADCEPCEAWTQNLQTVMAMADAASWSPPVAADGRAEQQP